MILPFINMYTYLRYVVCTIVYEIRGVFLLTFETQDQAGLSQRLFQTITCTVKPVYCHERLPILKDHILLTEGPTFQCN